MTQGSGDTGFTGSIPATYQERLVPLLFTPWATLLAERVAARRPQRILETAAGTGVVTVALAKACPDAQIVATDLNPAMLEVAKALMPNGADVRFQPADACALPFADERFDAVVSQFGIMFFPDRVKGYAEAARVLTPGGALVAALWGSLDENPVSGAVHQAMERAFPGDPPRFLARTPFSCHDADLVVSEAEDGGFTQVSVERITLPHPPVPAEFAAEGLVLGSPLRAEVEERGLGAVDRALAEAKRAVAAFADAQGNIAAEMTALVVTAEK